MCVLAWFWRVVRQVIGSGGRLFRKKRCSLSIHSGNNLPGSILISVGVRAEKLWHGIGLRVIYAIATYNTIESQD